MKSRDGQEGACPRSALERDIFQKPQQEKLGLGREAVEEFQQALASLVRRCGVVIGKRHLRRRQEFAAVAGRQPFGVHAEYLGGVEKISRIQRC